MIDLWELMRAVEEDATAAGQKAPLSDRVSFMRTHPTSETRHESLERDLASAMRLWKQNWPEKAESAAKAPAPPSNYDDGPPTAGQSAAVGELGA